MIQNISTNPPTGPIVWQPDEEWLSQSNLDSFRQQHGLDSLDRLWERSVREPNWFWPAVADYLGIGFDPPTQQVLNLENGKPFPKWFEGGGINLSQLCCDRWAESNPDGTALLSNREDRSEPERVSFAQLTELVGKLGAGLQELGVQPGMAVAVYLPMSAEAVISMLATVRIGAIFVPIFSGFGPEAVSARLFDPTPQVVITADGFWRRNRLIRMKEVADRALEHHPTIEHVVVVDYAHRQDTPWYENRDRDWGQLIDRQQSVQPHPTTAEDPLLIAYTSGTTGKPKGAVHVHGGFALKVGMEGAFQTEIRAGQRVMWVTDMGWIMGPWTVTAALVNGATLVTYDGAPDFPGTDKLWELTETNQLNFLGVSPTLIRVLQPHGTEPVQSHDISSLQVFGSTGEPWNPDPWWWLFRDVGQEQVPIVNITGGTEVGACILSVHLSDGLKPVSVGRPTLGMAVDVFNPQGESIRGEKGELVITNTWPAITRGFWGDRTRYLDTYWSKFPGVWTHGDWATVDPDGFWFLHGRSDDTLNIGGKRIGPAEIESVVVELAEVSTAAAIGVPDPVKGMAVAIYAVPNPRLQIGPDLEQTISDLVAETLGKGFRPQEVVLVSDLPRTRSAKIMRRVIRALALGEPPGDLTSLENPESLNEISPIVFPKP